jgi:hypothetical protein
MSECKCDTKCSEENCCEQDTNEFEAETFDKTRASRMETLKKAEKIIEKAHQGAKLDRKDMIFALKEMYKLSAQHEGVLQALMNDILQVVRIAGTSDKNIAMLSISLSALFKILVEKKIVSQEEIMAAWTTCQQEVIRQEQELTKKQQEKVKLSEVTPEQPATTEREPNQETVENKDSEVTHLG